MVEESPGYFSNAFSHLYKHNATTTSTVKIAVTGTITIRTTKTVTITTTETIQITVTGIITITITWKKNNHND